MNSPSRCGRSFNSKDESSSTGAAETRRSQLSSKLGVFLKAATGRIVSGNGNSGNCELGSHGQLRRSIAKISSQGNDSRSWPPRLAPERMLGSSRGDEKGALTMCHKMWHILKHAFSQYSAAPRHPPAQGLAALRE